MNADALWVNAKIATFDPAVNVPYGLRDGWALAIHNENVAAILPPDSPEIPGFRGPVHDCTGKWMTPAFIDCHTHLVWAGSRAQDWQDRLTGVPYTEIAKRGGGILSTMRAVRAATEDELVALAVPRLRALAAEGVMCVEIKSGYGLTTADELKMLRAAKRVAAEVGVELSSTLLAAHAVPPESLGIGRSRQVNKEGWARKRKAKD